MEKLNEYLYIPEEGDSENIEERVKKFSYLNKKDLIEKYNEQVKFGISGHRYQALNLLALNYIMLSRFGKSPIKLKDHILSLGGKIHYTGNTYEYIDKKEQEASIKEMEKTIIENKKREERSENIRLNWTIVKIIFWALLIFVTYKLWGKIAGNTAIYGIGQAVIIIGGIILLYRKIK